VKQELGEREFAVLRSAIAKMAAAAEQVGLTPDDLIAMLNSGMTTTQVLEYIIGKAAGTTVEN
jgi:hypothetical protein